MKLLLKLLEKGDKNLIQLKNDFIAETSWNRTTSELFYGYYLLIIFYRVFSIPHASKKSKGGEDCYFVNNRYLLYNLFIRSLSIISKINLIN